MQSVPDRVGVAIHRLVVLTFVAVGMLVSATPVLAADPTAYLASMPTAEEVTTRFVGSDSFDTAARQYAAFERLDALMGKLIGDRLVTAPERAVRDVYYNNPGWVGLAAQVKASLPADQREYYTGTRFAAWRALIDTYRADPTFNDQFLSLFPAAFRQANASTLASLAADGKTPSLPPATSAPTVVSTLEKSGLLLPRIHR